MKLFSKIILLLLVLTIMSCVNVEKVKKQPIDQQMKIANQLFEKSKYRKAKEIYENITFLRNSKYTAEAHYKLAECEFRDKNYSEASFQYNQLKMLFPDYEKINEVYFKIGVCLFLDSSPADYTQEETEQAINAFQDYIQKFPYDENKKEAIEYIQKANKKLIEKTYKNGYIYYKISDFTGALYYFDQILKLGNNNEIDKKSYYYSTLIYIKREDRENAESFLQKLVKKYPESKETAKAVEEFDEVFEG